MASNREVTLKNSQDRLLFLIENVSHQITALDKAIEDKQKDRQALMEVRAILRDHNRLIEMDLRA